MVNYVRTAKQAIVSNVVRRALGGRSRSGASRSDDFSRLNRTGPGTTTGTGHGAGKEILILIRHLHFR